ncbi:MAG: type II toxin-antitoxin system Phd/YefM family antitoxin [Planctomycetota bacterium]|jgi:antitoxin (DNA-binding transcriptional repressor) of toxin-antitoxin stability system
MKRVTASEARRNWFRVLDEVAAGETVVVERHGRRIVIRREQGGEERSPEDLPDYSALLSAPKADEADRWRWEWTGPEGDLELQAEGE